MGFFQTFTPNATAGSRERLYPRKWRIKPQYELAIRHLGLSCPGSAPFSSNDVETRIMQYSTARHSEALRCRVAIYGIMLRTARLSSFVFSWFSLFCSLSPFHSIVSAQAGILGQSAVQCRKEDTAKPLFPTMIIVY